MHLTTSAALCLEACVLLWAEFWEVSATPSPYRDCPSSLTLLPFLCRALPGSIGKMEPGEKGSVLQHAFGLVTDHRPDSALSTRPFLWVCAKPLASWGQTPLAAPVCSEVPTSEFLVSGTWR